MCLSFGYRPWIVSWFKFSPSRRPTYETSLPCKSTSQKKSTAQHSYYVTHCTGLYILSRSSQYNFMNDMFKCCIHSTIRLSPSIGWWVSSKHKLRQHTCYWRFAWITTLWKPLYYVQLFLHIRVFLLMLAKVLRFQIMQRFYCAGLLWPDPEWNCSAVHPVHPHSSGRKMTCNQPKRFVRLWRAGWP